jgi:hypothetical protein
MTDKSLDGNRLHIWPGIQDRINKTYLNGDDSAKLQKRGVDDHTQTFCGFGLDARNGIRRAADIEGKMRIIFAPELREDGTSDNLYYRILCDDVSEYDLRLPELSKSPVLINKRSSSGFPYCVRDEEHVRRLDFSAMRYLSKYQRTQHIIENSQKSFLINEALTIHLKNLRNTGFSAAVEGAFYLYNTDLVWSDIVKNVRARLG